MPRIGTQWKFWHGQHAHEKVVTIPPPRWRDGLIWLRTLREPVLASIMSEIDICADKPIKEQTHSMVAGERRTAESNVMHCIACVGRNWEPQGVRRYFSVRRKPGRPSSLQGRQTAGHNVPA